jgi:CheY-like chemotaxis protein
MSERNVLVVEDDDTIRRLLVEYLKQHSYVSVDGARDGIEALHQLALKRYAAVVLDVLMPKMSGVDFLNSLEAMMEDSSLRPFDDPPAILVITATPANELPRETLEQRYPRFVQAVFRKPLEFGELALAVEKYVSRP